MFEQIQNNILLKLWNGYITSIPKFPAIFKDKKPKIDHLALIDLPSQNSGIPYLYKLFNKLGFVKYGKEYLVEKNNDFMWIAPKDLNYQLATKAFPQIIIADYRLEELTLRTRRIIEKYVNNTKSIDFSYLELKIKDLRSGNTSVAKEISDYVYYHLTQRQWVVPTLNDFLAVREENQLIAWTMVFGRKVNHFGVNINLLGQYNSLASFNQ